MIIKGKYKVTNRGWIAAACLILLVIVLGVNALNGIEKSNKDAGPSGLVSNPLEALENPSTIEDDPKEIDSVKVSTNDDSATKMEESDSAETGTTTTEEAEVVIEEAEFMGIKETVYFDGDQFILKEEYSESLNRVYEYVKDLPGFDIVIEGNINAYPNLDISDEGQTISLKRAESIKAYFINKGIENERILIIDNFEKKPLIKEGTYGDFKVNRRADIYLIKKEN